MTTKQKTDMARMVALVFLMVAVLLLFRCTNPVETGSLVWGLVRGGR